MEDKLNLASTTTLEQDIWSKAQRDLNMTWEITQSRISQIVVATTCIGVLVSLTIRAVNPERLVAFPSEWWAIVGLVIGFYFGRTNHARITGTGPQATNLDDRG